MHDVMHADMLQLDAMPVQTGYSRFVYRHPHDASLWIKVVRPDILAEYRRGEVPWYKRLRLRRIGAYGVLLRELRELLSLHGRHPGADLPLPRMLGCVSTNLGMGLLLRAQHDADGKPSPTLAQVLHRSDAHRLDLPTALDRLRDELLRYEVIVSNARPGNLLLVDAGTPAQRLVLTEGFGEKNFVPRCSLSRRFNAANTQRRIGRLQRLVQQRLAASRASAPARAQAA